MQKTISHAIHEYLEVHKKKTPNWIATKSDIGYSTIKRAMDGEKTNLENSLKILEIVIPNTAQRLDFIKKCYPELKYILKNQENNFATQEEDTEEVELRKKPVYSQIYQWSSNIYGVSKSDVKAAFGDYGLTILAELVKNKYLVKKHDNYFLKKGQYVIPEAEELRKIAKLNLDLGNFADHRSLLKHCNAGLNKNGIRKIKDIVTNCFSKIENEATKSENTGNIPIFLDLALGAFDSPKKDSDA